MRDTRSLCKGGSYVSAAQLTRESAMSLLERASWNCQHSIKARTDLNGRLLVSAFYQSSTRTRLSFESAMARLGGQSIGFSDPKAVRAGGFYAESLADTLRAIQSFGDLIVLRHSQEDALQRALDVIDIPLINAGDGWGEHPTQALGDLLTVWQEFGRIDGLTILIVGDCRIRTVNSLVIAASNFNVRFVFLHPLGKGPPEHVLAIIKERGVIYEFGDSLPHELPRADIIYMENYHQPDHASGDGEQPCASQETPSSFVLNRAIFEEFSRKHSIIMAALPRMGELDTDLDALPAAAYWRQVEYGVFARMALIETIFGIENICR